MQRFSSQAQIGRSVATAAGRATAARRMRDDDSLRQARLCWVAACHARLVELDPVADPGRLLATATELAAQLGHFDPLMAAEMEHESR